MVKEAGFGRKEKLKSRKRVEELFSKGKTVTVFPIRISYQLQNLPVNEKAILEVGVSVSKRNFKRAVDRNRIKRLLREAYRLQKKDLLELLASRNKKGYVFFIYTDKGLPEYATIYETMKKCLDVLKRKAAIHENPS
jgi:ribonuclease P protein component